MRGKSFELEIEPKVLEWALKTSGWTAEEISRKLKTSASVVNGWLNGEIKPTILQAEKLAGYVKRPFAVFLLSNPPQDKPLPHDFRMLPERPGTFEKKTLLAIRKAERLQALSRELLQNLDIETKPKLSFASLSSNPEETAIQERQRFGVNVETQFQWKDSYQAFNFWKNLIEQRNIMVFQMSMPVEDARGFSLGNEEPSTIIISSSDSIEARIFTLLHEYGHALLKESGVCMPEARFIDESKEAKVEKWCNEFASAFLIPKDNFAQDIRNIQKNELLESLTLTKLSRKYKVSKSAFLLAMLKFNFISKESYENVMENLKSRKPRMMKGFILPDKKCFEEKGQKFISAVYQNVKKGLITNHDALDYLSVKSKYYDKIVVRITK